MAETVQNYSNHAHRPTLTNVAALAALLALIILLYALAQVPSLQNLGLVLLTLAVLTLVAISRVYTVRLQDRIIRLEMQLRLERLGRGADLPRLNLKQLTALRFASDPEVPALLDRIFAEHLTPIQIKQAVREWQGDFLRT